MEFPLWFLKQHHGIHVDSSHYSPHLSSWK
jgi:hypothetical protein